MTDLVNSATWTSKLDASNFASGAEQMTASADAAAASVARMDVATQTAGKNAVVTEAGLARLARAVDPSYAAYQRFTGQVEKLNAFQAAGFSGTNLEIAQRGLQLKAVESLGAGLASFEKNQLAAANAIGLGVRALGQVKPNADSALISWANVDRLLERMAVRVGALVAVGGLIEFGKNVYQNVAALEDQAKVLNLSVEAMQAYERSATLAGVATDTVDHAIMRVSANIGQAQQTAGQQRSAFADLGLTPQDLSGGLENVLPKVAQALLNLPDAAQRARDEMVLFGRSGQEITPALEQWAQGTDKLTARMKNLGLVVDDETAAKAKQADVKITAAFEHMQTSAAPAIVAVADAAGHLLDNLNALASADWSTKLGAVANAFFGRGPIGSILALFGNQTSPTSQPLASPATPSLFDASKMAGAFASAPPQPFGTFGIGASSGPGSANWDQGGWDKYLAGRAEEARLTGLSATEQAAEREAIAESAEKQRLNGAFADQINRSYKFATTYLTSSELSLARQNGLLTAQDKLAKGVKETFDGYLSGLQQEARSAGLSAAQREREADVIKAAQAAQKEHNVAARDLVKTYEDAVRVLGQLRTGIVENTVDTKLQNGILAQQKEQIRESLAGLTASKDQRALAMEYAKAELTFSGQSLTTEKAKLQTLQAINNATSFKDIIEGLQEQNTLAGMYGDHLERERQIMEDIDKLNHGLSDPEADRLRMMIDQNKALTDRAKLLSSERDALKGMYDDMLSGKKMDWKSIAKSFLDPIRQQISGDLADFTMNILFPQKNVKAGGSGIEATLSSLLGGEGAVPKGTSLDPLYVQFAGVGSTAGSLASGSSGGLLGMFSKGGLMGSGGFFSNLFNGGGGAGSLSSGLLSIFSSFAGMFADGGGLGAGQWGIAGENGPEIISGGTGGATVIPFAQMPSRTSAGHTTHINIDARGATPGMEDRIREIARQEIVPAVHATYRKSVHDSVQAVSSRNYSRGRGTL